DDGAQVVLDRALVLRRRGNDLRVDDRPVPVEAVPVVEEAARRLADPEAGPGDRSDLDEGRIRLLVGVDQPQRLVARVHELDAANDDAPECVAAFLAET